MGEASSARSLDLDLDASGSGEKARGFGQHRKEVGLFPLHVAAQARHEILGVCPQHPDRDADPFPELVREALEPLQITAQALVIFVNVPSQLARPHIRSSPGASQCNSRAGARAFGARFAAGAVARRPSGADARHGRAAVRCPRRLPLARGVLLRGDTRSP